MRTRFSKSRASVNVRAALLMADMAACKSPSSGSDTADDSSSTLPSWIAGNESRAVYSGWQFQCAVSSQCSKCRILAKDSIQVHQYVLPRSEPLFKVGRSFRALAIAVVCVAFLRLPVSLKESAVRPLRLQSAHDAVAVIAVVLSSPDRAHAVFGDQLPVALVDSDSVGRETLCTDLAPHARSRHLPQFRCDVRRHLPRKARVTQRCESPRRCSSRVPPVEPRGRLRTLVEDD